MKVFTHDASGKIIGTREIDDNQVDNTDPDEIPQHTRSKRALLQLPPKADATSPKNSHMGTLPAVERRITNLWLRGYSLGEIQELAGIKDARTIIRYITAAREQLKKLNTEILAEATNEIVGTLRHIRTRAWEYADAGINPSSMLNTIQKNVELEARIRGVLRTDVKVEGEIFHRKLYTFENNLPPPIVEGQIVQKPPALPPPPTCEDEVAAVTEKAPIIDEAELNEIQAVAGTRNSFVRGGKGLT